MKIRKDRVFIFISIVCLGILFIIYASRFTYFFITEKKNMKVDSTLFNEYLINYSKISKTTDNSYIFKGKDVNNYVLYNGIMFRIVSIDTDKHIKLISDDSLTSMVFGYNEDYINSYVNEWLNKTEDENTGIFENSLDSPRKYLVNTKMCIDEVKDLESYKCTNYNNEYLVGLLSMEEYINAGGEDSYLNNGTYWWLSNTSNNNAWYVIDDGTVNNIIKSNNTYYGYGVRPVITLNENIVVSSGDGTKENPYIFESNDNKILLNKNVGSYVEYNDYIWKIVSKNEYGVKVVMTEYVKGNDMVIGFSNVSSIYNTNSLIGGYLNKTFYKTLDNEDYLVDGPWYYGNYNYLSKYDYKKLYDNEVMAKLGLLTIGDIFLNDVKEVFTTAINSKNMVYVIEEDNSIKTSLITEELKIRPAAYLDGKLNVSGKGTLDDPLKLSRGDTNEN